jgi:hypothetical protein
MLRQCQLDLPLLGQQTLQLCTQVGGNKIVETKIFPKVQFLVSEYTILSQCITEALHCLKVHLHDIFYLRFFASKEPTWSPELYPKSTLNMKTFSPSYSNLQLIQHNQRICGEKNRLCQARVN